MSHPNVQHLRPIATVAAGLWVPVGAPTLHEATDEDPPNDDTDYIEAGSTTACQLQIAAGVNPDGGIHKVRLRATAFQPQPTVGMQWNLRLIGSTVLATFTQLVLPVGWAWYEGTLTPAQVANITNYANLAITITALFVAGTERVRISACELRAPMLARGMSARAVDQTRRASVL